MMSSPELVGAETFGGSVQPGTMSDKLHVFIANATVWQAQMGQGAGVETRGLFSVRFVTVKSLLYFKILGDRSHTQF